LTTHALARYLEYEPDPALMTFAMAGWFPLGDAQLLVVSDGVLRLDAGAVFGLTPRVMWEPYADSLTRPS
jgi:hypothetical protein